jgi:hypothetical protein
MTAGVGRSIAGSVCRLLAAVVMAAALLGAASALPATSAAPRVTIFGDSAADVLDYVADAKQYLGQGLDVNWELRVCRRLVQLSCPYQGVRPPTVLDVVQASAKGALGSIAVVDVGYNDYVDQYQSDMDTVIKALIGNGVEHIIWTTMHEVRDDYRNINATIQAEAAKWPQVVIADWNADSQGQDWFNSDGIHLNSAGAWGLARLLRPLILSACGDPCRPPPAPAPAPSFVIRATAAWIRVGRFTVWKPPLRGTYAQATAAFGPATTCRLLAGKKSRASWTPLGLVMQFIAARGSVCATSTGTLLQTLTVTGARWKTSNGLAVGDPVSKLELRYPNATAHPGSYWLVKDDRAGNHALFTAVVRGGRVAAFSLAVRVES